PWIARALAAGTVTIAATDGVSGSATLIVDPTTIEIVFAGGGLGDVYYRHPNPTPQALNGDCESGCTIPAVVESYTLEAPSPSRFVNFSGACTSTAPTCDFVPQAGSNVVVVTFDPEPNEQWTRLLTFPS